MLLQQVQADLLDLAILWTNLRIHSARGNPKEARRQALEVLQQAEELFGSSAVLCRQLQAHAQALGLSDLAQQAGAQAASLPPRTAWEHFALGRTSFRAGQTSETEEHLQARPRPATAIAVGQLLPGEMPL